MDRILSEIHLKQYFSIIFYIWDGFKTTFMERVFYLRLFSNIIFGTYSIWNWFKTIFVERILTEINFEQYLWIVFWKWFKTTFVERILTEIHLEQHLWIVFCLICILRHLWNILGGQYSLVDIHLTRDLIHITFIYLSPLDTRKMYNVSQIHKRTWK